ncbi:hypothetical protein [Sphingomonas montana]|uniref:hypothetical protein n=1 Tax=Sphingomonas montana TaxID=1843236 RepID=UPI0009F849C9|nr:hypothetical protein [Sphingomonas montana]
MAVAVQKAWDGGIVRTWLDSRIVAARADQVAAERGGRALQDDCDKATAEEMVCTLMKAGAAADAQASFLDGLRLLLDREDYVWRGVYDDMRFDRHVRSYIRKLARMAKTNDGFGKTAHYQ